MKARRTQGILETHLVTRILIVAAFASLFWVAWSFAERERAVALELYMQDHAAAFSLSTLEELRLATEALRAMSSLFVAVDDVTSDEFDRFARGYLQQDESLMVLEWQPLVPGAERARFERETRAQGLNGFWLWEPGADGKPIAARPRELHVPVHYMASQSGATDTRGLDLAWSEERMRSKWAARDAGRPEASDFFPVVTGPNAQVSPLGMAITLPIFSDGLVPDNKDARRERLIGYLAGVYDLETLLLRPLSELGARGLNALLTDGGMSGNQVARTVGDGSGFGHEQSISVLGRDWRLRVELTSDQAFAANGSRFYILPGVVVLVGLVVLGFMTLLARKATALSRARERLATALSNEQASKAELLELSRHDPLTGLLNRRAFFEQLQSEIQRASRHDVSMTLMMMDLDRFKRINDGWGHPTGDEALRLFAKICVEQLRETDLVARIGGEEFGCVLIHADLDTASMIAERLRRAVAGATVASDPAKGELKLSVSIGLAAHDRHMTPERLVRHADQALYQAKDSGRNRVEVYDDAQQPPSSGVSSCLPSIV